MAKIIDQYGKPIDRGALKEPQTSRIASLENQYLTPMLAGLTPARLASILRAADEGDLTAQHRLFADMEERDTHIAAEMGKRRLAVMGLDWDIVPPRAASAAETHAAAWAKDVLLDAVVPLEDLILALMEGVGHGFAAVELVWRQEGREWLPEFLPRPQEWFRLDRLRREIRLDDASAEGAPLQPFGWALHTHGTPKTGYLGRAGLHRALVWPFLYKAYALGDFAQFLETYGLPIVVGKYHQGASADEKASLLRAVTALGHDARAIMPADMALEIQKVAADGGGTPHLALMDWCERAISKAILGGTLTSGTEANGNRALGEVHNDIRRDLRDADARQIAGTITRDLIYPLIALNLGGIASLRRCPRLVFDSGEVEDLFKMAEALPKLVQAGMTTIPLAWVHEKLRIPQPTPGEPTLGGSEPMAKPDQTEAKPAALAALTARGQPAAIDPVDAQVARLAPTADAQIARLVDTLESMLDAAGSLDEFRAMLEAAWPQLPADGLAERLAEAMIAAELAGRAEVADEIARQPPAAPPVQVNLAAELKLPEGLAALLAEKPAAAATAPPIVNVTVPPAEAPVVHVTVQPADLPAIHVAAPVVSVSNAVQPAPVQTVVTPAPHPARAIQTVERDPQTLEVTRTITHYEKE